MTGETSGDQRNYGNELRDTSGDRQEQTRLLREMVIEAAGVDEDAARRVLDAFHDARIVFITEEGWERSTEASRSLSRLGAIASGLMGRAEERRSGSRT